MGNPSDEFRQLLEDGNIDALRRAWSRVAPGMPQPKSRSDAEVVMHMARTSAARVAFHHRAYSHRWLTERLMPSQLPDHLKPSAERLFPRVVDAVGVSVGFRSPVLAPAAVEVRSAINAAVEDCYAEGRTDVGFVRRRMQEARAAVMHALFGRQRA